MSHILCRFVTYNHLMAFWRLIEPASHNMVRVTRARAATTRSEGGASGNASVIIYIFYLSFLSNCVLYSTYNIHYVMNLLGGGGGGGGGRKQN